MVQNWKLHKALAFLGMIVVAAVLLEINGMTMSDKLFDVVTFKYVALGLQAYAAWVWYSLVKF